MARSSLNGVAAALVLLDGGDDAALATLRADLERLAPGQPEGARKLLSEAAVLLSSAQAVEASSRGTFLEQAGRLLEAAMNGGNGARPAQDVPAPQALSLPANIDRELLGNFISESRENLQSAEAALLTLETDPGDGEAINVVFRAFHTLKGLSSFLEIPLVSELAHHAESLLSRFRDGKLRFGGTSADLSLRTVDMFEALVQSVQDALGGQSLAVPPGYAELLEQLRNPETALLSPPPSGSDRIGDILVESGRVLRGDVEAAAAHKGGGPIGLALVRSQAATLEDVAGALRKQRALKGAEPEGERFVRVRTERLDRLIDSIGELVIAQSMVAQDQKVRSDYDRDLLRKVSHAGKIVRELQDLGMSMRMVPLKTTFQKMTRLARDLSRKSGKEVSVCAVGEETEIDRNMVDVVDELLMHMVRNAVDHGLEAPADRARGGKLPQGSLRLAAYHSGGNVVFDIQDDGRGLDRERILRKARERGLLAGMGKLSDRDICNLIFLPGFSTAERVTEVSGRGVGMDVVKKGVESLHGSIDIRSEPGKGCAFSLKLPLTMAVTEGMLVLVGDQRFILPTIHIRKLLRPDRSQLHAIAGSGEMVMLMGEPLPLVRLHRLFGIAGAVEDPCRGLLVIIEEGLRRCAVLVDALLHQQQVVAKSLGERIGRVAGFSGGAILGDGRVGLILDPPALVTLAQQGNRPQGESHE